MSLQFSLSLSLVFIYYAYMIPSMYLTKKKKNIASIYMHRLQNHVSHLPLYPGFLFPLPTTMIMATTSTTTPASSSTHPP